ncbi:hypothetical protein COCVIDRAFT_89204 [Bipolaris victoriae FI3]|uniref:Uncharacterized protein n=1 Tax=Bipolaris victoriae (strain FI3) TaxID=930091 RepID=W7EV78_BIPV3|nr:hypothetical protein COCVIDRAFT_89204 [Bipolaris victoriae FI3]
MWRLCRAYWKACKVLEACIPIHILGVVTLFNLFILCKQTMLYSRITQDRWHVKGCAGLKSKEGLLPLT